jgi:uncharacterized protein with GYD domain
MLFCLTADYTPAALNAMRENPNTNRQAAVEQLLSAAGGKLVLAKWLNPTTSCPAPGAQ